jgi:hypothetical protein
MKYSSSVQERHHRGKKKMCHPAGAWNFMAFPDYKDFAPDGAEDEP